MTAEWLTHDDDRVWALVWLAWHTGSDNNAAELDGHDTLRALKLLLPHLTEEERVATLVEIVARLDVAADAEDDPVAAALRHYDDVPASLRDAGEALVERHRGEAWRVAVQAVALDESRASRPTPGHVVQVIAPTGSDWRAFASCQTCGWVSGHYSSPSMASAMAEQHRQGAAA